MNEGPAVTEVDWVRCTHPDRMLLFLFGLEASRRKLRLFGCSCFPAIRHLWPDPRVAGGVEVAERYAEGLAGHGEKEKVREWAVTVFGDEYCSDAGIVARAVAALNHNAETASWHLAMAEGCVAAGWHAEDWRASRGPDEFLSMCDPAGVLARDAVRSAQSDRLRCIFGNPFRPVALDPARQTSAVVALAHAAHDNRILPAGTLEPVRLAVLADALEEAGCTDDDILDHCRRPGTHVRGCWVVDLLLAPNGLLNQNCSLQTVTE